MMLLLRVVPGYNVASLISFVTVVLKRLLSAPELHTIWQDVSIDLHTVMTPEVSITAFYELSQIALEYQKPLVCLSRILTALDHSTGTRCANASCRWSVRSSLDILQ